MSADLQSGVTQIFSNEYAFAALKEDGSVVTWGSSWAGGTSSFTSGKLSSGVSQISSTETAFAALKDDGSVVVWGEPLTGGVIPSGNNHKFGVTHIFSNQGSFAALKEDGSVFTWGDSNYGGDSSSVSTDLQSGVTNLLHLLRICRT